MLSANSLYFVWDIHIWIQNGMLYLIEGVKHLVLVDFSNAWFLRKILIWFWIDLTCRNYLSAVLVQELFMSWDHDDLAQRGKVRMHSVWKPTAFNLSCPVPSEKHTQIQLLLWYSFPCADSISLHQGCSYTGDIIVQTWVWCSVPESRWQAVYCTTVFSSNWPGNYFPILNSFFSKTVI